MNFLSPDAAHGLLRRIRLLTGLAVFLSLATTMVLATPPAKKSKPPQPCLQLTTPQIQQILGFLKTTDPEVYQKAQTLRRSNPAKFVRLISAAAPNFRRLERLQKSDPQLFSLTIQDISFTHRSFALADRLRQPGLTKRQSMRVRGRLFNVVAQQFGIRQKIRKLELNRLMEKINQLKSAYDQRKKNRTQIINKRVQDLIGKPPSVSW